MHRLEVGVILGRVVVLREVVEGKSWWASA